MLLVLFNMILILIGVWFVITQILLPLIFNLPMFPIFRDKINKTKEEIASLNEEAIEKRLQKKADKLKNDLKGK